MLSVTPGDGRLLITRTSLPFFPDVVVLKGTIARSTPGGVPEASVAVTAGQAILPLGCTKTREILEAIAPPVVRDSSRYGYAAVLAFLDGKTYRLGRAILDSTEIPQDLKEVAAIRRLQLPTARIRDFGRYIEVKTMVLEEALYFVTVHLGQK